MSAPAVIAIFEARLASDVTLPAVVQTVNVRPGTALPEQFLTLKRDFATVQRIGIGPSPNTLFREFGTLTIRVTVASGIGTDEAEALSQQVSDLFHNYAVTHFRVTVVNPPSFITPDEGNWFQYDVPVEYQYDFFK